MNQAAKSHPRTNQAVEKILRSDNVPGRKRNQQSAWKRFGPTENMEVTLSNPLRCLQAVQCAPGSQLLLTVTHAGVDFDDAAIFESSICLQIS